MQPNPVYLYSNKIDAFTNITDSWVLERFRKVYNRNQKIYRGADNKIDVQVKNSSQKAISIPEGSYLVFHLVNTDTGKLILKKDCVLVEDDLDKNLKGRAYVVLGRKELLDITPGFYQYSLIIEEREINGDEYRVTKKTPMYTDTQYGAYSVMEIFGDLSGEVEDSILINKFEYINPFNVGELDQRIYISSIIDAQPQISTPQSLHTLQMYFSGDYQGTVTIQGSLDEQGATPSKWIDIETLEPTLSAEYRNVRGKWNWFRIKHIPIQGTLDKILYR
jgi:hypothetical protein